MRNYYTPEERQTYNERRIAEMNGQIKELAASWESKPEDVAEYLDFQSRFYQYSSRNTMLIYKQNPGAMFVGSYNFFKEAGYHVQKGEHGINIMVYAPITFFRKKADTPWHRVSSASPDEKTMIRAGMLETREQAYYKVGTVFDIAQTDCPIEDYPKLAGLGYNDEQHAEIYKVVCDYCKKIGMSVGEANFHSSGLRGHYNASTREISINEKLGDTQKLSTVLHEMAHGLMQHKGSAYEKSVDHCELEADALSIMFSNRFNVSVTDARKGHLVSCYKTFCNEQKKADKPIEIDKLFSPINEKFRLHSEKLVAQLALKGVLPDKAQGVLGVNPDKRDANIEAYCELFREKDTSVDMAEER